MRFKIDRARHIVGRKFTVFALFCFVFGAISKYKRPPPRGVAYIRRCDLTEGFWRYEFGGFIFGGAYKRGLFSEFYGILSRVSFYK